MVTTRNTLQQVARDNFGILPTVCLKIVGFLQLFDEFTSIDDRLLRIIVTEHVSYVSADWL